MSAEIICVGTELLLGEIVNTNVQFLAQELAQLGIPHYYQNVVGDNFDRIASVITIALDRGAKILIFTGGLGPTPDDLTTEAIARYFKTPLVENQEVIKDIQEKFDRRGRFMTENNRKQALQPQGAEILPNPAGTAPGMMWQPREGIFILTFPGVPMEMKRMWQESAVPYLKSHGWGQEMIYSRVLRFRGITEAELALKINDYFQLNNPMVAPYASKGEVRLRVSAKAKNETEALAIINPIATELIAIGELNYFGENEDSLASVVGKLLQERQETLSVAESCTGGGLGAMLTEIAGSSRYFLGGIIAYDNRVKINLLDVSKHDLDQFGAVSETVAKQMALGVKNKLNTHWGIGITGIAGPGGGTTEKPVGLVYIGIADPNNTTTCVQYTLGHERPRDLIRLLSVYNALDQLRRRLKVNEV